MKSQKIVFGLLLGFVLAFFGYFFYCINFVIEDSYTALEGGDLSAMLPPFITSDGGVMETSGGGLGEEDDQSVTTVNIKVLDLFPVAQASVKTLKTPHLKPSGQCVGIKIHTGGLVVSGFGDFETDEGMCVSPGARAGLEAGDVIEAINGERTTSVVHFTEVCDKSLGDCSLTVARKDKKVNIRVKGKKCTDGHIRLGIFVKNSLAGIGTLTYEAENTGAFGALGHGITESGTVVPRREASVYNAEILNIVKGKKGSPGEIIGAIDEAEVMGQCVKNTEEGVYGILTTAGAFFPKVKAAPSSEVKTGKAHIICTTDSDEGARYYEAEIISVNHLRKNKTKSFAVEVTDKRLIEKTGGIVQGMSGSPILQNGKLIGAVTHVFVNDPTRGYGIFIENMLSEAEKVK